MTKIKIKILSDGTGKEVNKFGECPNVETPFNSNFQRWEQEENKLRTFTIENSLKNYGDSYDVLINDCWIGFTNDDEIIAEIINEEKLICKICEQ